MHKQLLNVSNQAKRALTSAVDKTVGEVSHHIWGQDFRVTHIFTLSALSISGNNIDIRIVSS